MAFCWFKELLCTFSISLAYQCYQLYRSRGLFFDITVTYFLPPIDGGDLQIATETATFKRTLLLLPHKATGEAARAAVATALRDLHVDDDGALESLSRKIVEKGDKLIMARRNSWIAQLKEIRLEEQICFCVDVLPPRNGFYSGALAPPSSNCYCDEAYDDGIRFVRVSKESIEGLLKMTEKTEEAVVCEECSEEVSIGSKLTRLPCSHRFHMDCIVSWLEESKLCPQCRFELP